MIIKEIRVAPLLRVIGKVRNVIKTKLFHTMCPWWSIRVLDIFFFLIPIDEVMQDIVPEAWYGFKNLVKYSYQNDCQRNKK